MNTLYEVKGWLEIIGNLSVIIKTLYEDSTGRLGQYFPKCIIGAEKDSARIEWDGQLYDFKFEKSLKETLSSLKEKGFDANGIVSCNKIRTLTTYEYIINNSEVSQNDISGDKEEKPSNDTDLIYEIEKRGYTVKKQGCRYITATSYSFDPEKRFREFASLNEAWDYAVDEAEDEFNIQKVENGREEGVDLFIEKDKGSFEARVIATGTDSKGEDYRDVVTFAVYEEDFNPKTY